MLFNFDNHINCRTNVRRMQVFTLKLQIQVTHKNSEGETRALFQRKNDITVKNRNVIITQIFKGIAK